MKTLERVPAKLMPEIRLASLEEKLALARTTRTVQEFQLALWRRVHELGHEPVVTMPNDQRFNYRG